MACSAESWVFGACDRCRGTKTRAYAARLAPARHWQRTSSPVMLSWHHDASRGRPSAMVASRGMAYRPHDAAQRRAEAVPAACMLRVRSAGCSPTASWRRSSQRTIAALCGCSDPSSADRARPPAASGNRRRGPGSHTGTADAPQAASMNAHAGRSSDPTAVKSSSASPRPGTSSARPERSGKRHRPGSPMTAPMTSRAKLAWPHARRRSTSSVAHLSWRGSDTEAPRDQCEHDRATP